MTKATPVDKDVEAAYLKQREEEKKELAKIYAPDEATTASTLPPAPAEREVILSDYRENLHIIWKPDGIWLRKLSKNKDQDDVDTLIIGGFVLPVARTIVDRETLFDYQLDNGEMISCTPKTLLTLLNDRGQLFDEMHIGQSLLNFLSFKMAKEVRITYATFGVFEYDAPGMKEKILFMNLDPRSQTDDQKIIFDKIGPYLKANELLVPLRTKDLAPYVVFNNYYHPYEIYPIVGSSMITPFSSFVKGDRHILANIIIYTPEVTVGKTTAVAGWTESMWANPVEKADSFNSVFRYTSRLSAASLAMGVDEIEALHQSIQSAMKTDAERTTGGRRGTRDQKINVYSALGSVIGSSNVQPINKVPVAKRHVIIHAADDLETLTKIAGQVEEYNENYALLRTIGYRILHELMSLMYSQVVTKRTFLENLHKNIGALRRLPGIRWHDPTRPDTWGVLLTGVELWEAACDLHDLPTRYFHFHLGNEEAVEKSLVETCERFYREVIAPNEITTFEMKVAPIVEFLSWFTWLRGERTYNRRVRDADGDFIDVPEVRGSEELYVECELPLPGFKVGRAVLTKFKEKHADVPISDLKQLTTQAAIYAGLDPTDVLDKDGNCPSIRVGRSTDRVAWVPRDLTCRAKVIPLPAKEELVDEEENDGGRELTPEEEREWLREQEARKSMHKNVQQGAK